jgi:hypothetical protein
MDFAMRAIGLLLILALSKSPIEHSHCYGLLEMSLHGFVDYRINGHEARPAAGVLYGPEPEPHTAKVELSTVNRHDLIPFFMVTCGASSAVATCFRSAGLGNGDALPYIVGAWRQCVGVSVFAGALLLLINRRRVLRCTGHNPTGALSVPEPVSITIYMIR